jgi:hypothetical protein
VSTFKTRDLNNKTRLTLHKEKRRSKIANKKNPRMKLKKYNKKDFKQNKQ